MPNDLQERITTISEQIAACARRHRTTLMRWDVQAVIIALGANPDLRAEFDEVVTAQAEFQNQMEDCEARAGWDANP